MTIGIYVAQTCTVHMVMFHVHVHNLACVVVVVVVVIVVVCLLDIIYISSTAILTCVYCMPLFMHCIQLEAANAPPTKVSQKQGESSQSDQTPTEGGMCVHTYVCIQCTHCEDHLG